MAEKPGHSHPIATDESACSLILQHKYSHAFHLFVSETSVDLLWIKVKT